MSQSSVGFVLWSTLLYSVDRPLCINVYVFKKMFNTLNSFYMLSIY
nr:MAG TPA: hypothetical protein [Bacteriophage sp.]